jgi:RNA polymerase-binding transcription factor DksA
MKDLQKKREQLEKQLATKEASHAQKFGQGSLNESSYQDSCREMKDIYEELSVVCEELGDPIPLKF